MALANLNINVNTNVAPVLSAMADVKAVTTMNMGKAGAAVQQFQTDFSKSAATIQGEASKISSEMKTTSDVIGKETEAVGKSMDVIAQKAKTIEVGNIGKKVSEGMDSLDEAETKFKKFADETKSYAERTAVFMAASIATGIAAGVFAAGYAAFKSLDFAAGLITGESYKSKDIDNLIAANDKVKELQKSLQLTAVDANALNDAMARLGVDKGDYAAVVDKVGDSLRNNTDELDRLGVKYADVNGKILQTREIVANAKTKLDEYTDGWDRNQAAAAMGLGTYEQINNYLKINQQEFQNSKARVDDYTLGIGTEAQAAIQKYQATMLAFNNELKLMGDGFKRAWADQIMPALTVTADFLKEGWPVAVRAFRYSMATITSLAYGLKTDFDIIYEGVAGSVKGIGNVTVGAGIAAFRTLQGDFSGAKAALVKGWEDAKTSISTSGDNIVKKTQANVAAMKLAWGFDNRDSGNGGKPLKGGKPWDSGTEEDTAAIASELKSYEEAYLRYANQFESNKAAAIKEANARLEAINQADYDKGLIDLKTYLDEKHQLNISALSAEITSRKEALEAARKAFSEADARDKEDGDIGTQTARLGALNDVLKAKRDLEKATNDLTLAEIKNGEESRKAIDGQAAKYKEISLAVLSLANDYVAAELAKQEAYKKSEEYLRLEADARSGNADAIAAIAAKQKQWAYDVVTAQGKATTETQKYADALASARDEVDKFNGKSQEAIQVESSLRDGLSKHKELQIQLNAAQAAGRIADIAYYTQKISLQDTVNQRLQRELELLERRQVLSGEIVGFNNGVAIYRNSYDQAMANTGYISDSSLVNNTTNNRGVTFNGGINVTVPPGSTGTGIGQNIATEMRNGIQTYNFQMLNSPLFSI